MTRLARRALLALPFFFLAALAASSEEGKGEGQKEKEKEKESWTSLFDGKSLQGWRTLSGKPAAGWEAKEGVLRVDTAQGARGQDIYTEKEYANFVLELEWKIREGGNSGVKYRMSWYGKEYLGPEYQILGEKAGRSAKGGPSKNLAGALYDLIPIDPSLREIRPAPEWNAARIVAKGNRIEHWLNGKKIVDVDVSSAEFKEAVKKSKFRNLEGFAQNPSGRIMLQYHGSEVSFRNIRIKELP